MQVLMREGRFRLSYELRPCISRHSSDIKNKSRDKPLDYISCKMTEIMSHDIIFFIHN